MAGLALYVGLFLATTAGAFVRAPFGDMFDMLTVEFGAQARGDPGLYLWQTHNGHHVVWMRTLTALDVRVFHGRSLVFAAAALAGILAATTLIARELWRGAPDRRLAAPLVAIAPIALLTTLNAVDVSLPVNSNYPVALAFAVGALILVEAGGAGLATTLGVTALIVAATLAISVGLAAAPVVMWSALVRRKRGWLPLLWVILPVLAVAVLLSPGIVVESAPASGSPIERAGRIGLYFLTFCGLPWSASSAKMPLSPALQPMAELVGPLLGLVVAALGAWLAARPGETRLGRVCRNLILLSLTAAAMAALGRVDVSTQLQVPLRYALLMAPLHVGVAVLLLLRLPTPSERALRVAAAGVVTLALAHQVAGGVLILRYSAQLRHAIAAFEAGDRSPATAQYVYPNLAQAERITAEMRRRGLYR
jgi:hypothetical protein